MAQCGSRRGATSRLGRFRWRVGVVCAVVLAIAPAWGLAQEPEAAEIAAEATPESTTEGDGDGKHLFDIGIQNLDTPVGNFSTTLLGYTRAFRGDMSVTAAVTLTFSELFQSTDRGTTVDRYQGTGDTILIYSFAPGKKITANPWVPRSIGFSLILVVPTGNAANFLGGDQFVITPQAGWVIHVSEHFDLLPAVLYTSSFAHGDRALPVELLSAELGMVWAHRTGWWISYSPSIVRDLKRDDWDYNDTFSVGKMFNTRIGLSLAHGTLEKVDPNAIRNDQQWMLFFHYVMPNRTAR